MTRVLIVEDDPAARVGLEQLVKSWGFVADSATDGQEALEKVTTFRPAIVWSSRSRCSSGARRSDRYASASRPC